MVIELELVNRINLLKTELDQIVKAKGLNNLDTLCCSQKLDELITIYQKCLQEANSKNEMKQKGVKM